MKEDALDTVQKCLQATKDFVLKRLADADVSAESDDRVDDQGDAFVSCEEARAYYAGCIEALFRAQGRESVALQEAGAANRELLRFILEEKRLPVMGFVTNREEQLFLRWLHQFEPGMRSEILKRASSPGGRG